MPAIPASVFAEQLRELDHEQLVRFVAALWDRSGWETRIDGPVVVASRADSRQRLLVLPSSRFPRLRTAPETDGPVDQVVTPRLVDDGATLPRNTPSAPLLDAAALRNRLLYAIDSDQGNQLATEYLGVAPRAERWQPREPALVRFGQQLSNAVEPAEKHVSRRAALGTLGVSLLAGGAWVVTNETQSETKPDDGEPLGNSSISTPETSVPETASFAFSVADGDVTITHDGGAVIAAGQLLIRSEGLSAPSETTWSQVSPIGPDGIVKEGDSVTLGAGERFQITVVLDQDDGEQQLAEFSRGLPDLSEIEFPDIPDASFTANYDPARNRLTVTHEAGDPIRAGELYVRGSGFAEAPSYRWSEQANTQDTWPVQPGDSVQLSGVKDSVVIRVVRERDDIPATILDRYYGPGRPRAERIDGIMNDQYGPQKRGFTTAQGPGGFPVQRWEFEMGRPFGASTTIQRGVMVVTQDDGVVYGLDAEDGVVLWESEVTGSTGGTPTAVDGKVYIRQFTRNSTGLVALDLFDGSAQWSVELPQRQIGQPILSDGSLFIAATGGPASTSSVYAIDASDARANWSDTVDAFVFPAHIAAAEGVVYTAAANRVRALDAESGSIQWEFEQPSDFEGDFWGPIVLEDGLVVSLLGDQQMRMYRLDLDGTERWQTELFRTPSTYPVVAGERLVIPMDSADLRTLSVEDGSEDWQFITEDEITALTATSEYVYAVESDTIHVIDSVAGVEEGSNVKYGNKIRSVVAAEGRLFTVGSTVMSFEGVDDIE
jgi:outer membrane protein assembly factor BamB